MTTRINYRTDSVYYVMFPAAAKRDRKKAPPPAQPGDTWPLVNQRHERIAYCICCPKCGQIHMWAHADNCGSRRPLPSGGTTCDHEQKQVSCWNWSGSPEAGNLSALPSLLSTVAKGGCGWHGYLTNNVLEGG